MYEICPNLLDFDELFMNDPTAQSILIKCGPEVMAVKSPMEERKRLFFQDGSKELSHISTCECGRLRGNFYEGQECPTCHTVCKTNFAESLKFRAWFEIPDFAPPVLHPVAYQILRDFLGNSKTSTPSMLDALLDCREVLPPNRAHFGQGFAYFYEHFDEIMHWFMYECKDFRNASGKKKKIPEIEALITKYRKCLFIRHIPILNQALHLLTASGSMSFSDKPAKPLLEMYNIMTRMVNKVGYGSVRRELYINNQLFKFYKAYIEYQNSIINEKLIHKEGFIRRAVMGARLHCTARAVIVPLLSEDRLDCVHLPWSIGVSLYELELVNLLMHRRGMSMPDAKALIDKATIGYDPVVAEMLDLLITECQQITNMPGLPLLVGRNPSINFGAIMLLFCSQFKKTFTDDTITIDASICEAPNFDYDGDAMHVVSIKEMNMVPHLMSLHPMMLMLNSDSAGISTAVSLTKQAVVNLNCWLFEENQ